MCATSTTLTRSSSQALTARSTPTAVSVPGTPTARPSDVKAIEVKPSPGAFRHPQLSEVIRRQSRSTLTERNIRTAAFNGVALILSLAWSYHIHKYLNLLLSLTPLNAPSHITSSTLTVIRLLFLANIILSLRPILPYSKPTTYDDIPLTPSQRKLLGLPPSSIHATPSNTTPGTTTSAASFITPPRYTRRLSSSTSPSPSNQLNFSADRRSISANSSSSPLSTSRHALGFSLTPNTSTSTYRRTASGSPFSPSSGNIAGSPLFHKAVHNRDRQTAADLNFDVSNRASTLGLAGTSSSSLGRSQSVKERGNSRTLAKRREESEREKKSPLQKGVNYKWLYDKGFGLSGRGSGGLTKSESMAF